MTPAVVYPVTPGHAVMANPSPNPNPNPYPNPNPNPNPNPHQVDGLGARWRDRTIERALHAAKATLLEAEIGQLRSRFGQLVSVAGPALDGGKALPLPLPLTLTPTLTRTRTRTRTRALALALALPIPLPLTQP